MPEVHAFCEYLTVLRNGKDIGTAWWANFPDDEVVRMIVGRSLSATFPARDTTPDHAAPPAIEARSVSVGGRLSNASFRFARGEALASPDCRAWDRGNCSSHASAPR